MSFYNKMMLRKKHIIETINNLLKNKVPLVHSRHRSITNFPVNLVAVLGVCYFFENKPDALQGYLLRTQNNWHYSKLFPNSGILFIC